MTRVAVIGGGAAGLTAAITAAKNGAKVTVLERMERVGKKIMATGNGRCNLANNELDLSHYRGDERFISQVFHQVGLEEILDFFREIGLLVRTEQGRIYPLSNHASAVLDVLRNEAERCGVTIKTDFDVKSVCPRSEGLVIQGKYETLVCDKLIIATGGKASPAHGSNGSGYDILSSLGHHTTKLYPGLVGVKCPSEQMKGLRGVRVFAKATLLLDGQPYRSEIGEIQFNDTGLSGIPILNCSSVVTSYKGEAEIELDLLPDEEDVLDLLQERDRKHLFTGMFHKQIGQSLCDRTWVPVQSIQTVDLPSLAKEMKAMRFTVIGTLPWENAQVTVGGAKTSEFQLGTLESLLLPGLYAAGEILDVDGDCGGYNLMWAWASGMVAGQEAANA
ncbi:MAG: aminoacetone oxidase family FAD-binding enzyme [Ruminococcaceae bacterium]|nr:aminoacetone oxidase family FAD-binding enzyme [Oscillospiraceae bacterium]